MQQKRLFITGIAGMLGMHLLEKAVQENYKVYGTFHNNLPQKLQEYADQGKVELFQIDLTKNRGFGAILKKCDPDVIVHLAGKVLSNKDSKISDTKIYRENVSIIKNVISTLEKTNPTVRFVLVSGCIVYNKSVTSKPLLELKVNQLPQVELAEEPYRASRIEQERVLFNSRIENYVIVRPTQITGPGKIDGAIEYHIASELFEASSKPGKKSVEVGNKLAEVDLLDARDAASALLLLAHRGKAQEIYHLNPGRPVTLGKLAKEFLDALGLKSGNYKIKSVSREKRSYFRFSNQKLISLGWKSEYSLQETLNYYHEYFREAYERRLYGGLVDVLIPTHNRPKFLKRVLDYYLKYGNYFNFIVTDSSNRTNKIKNKKIISEFKSLNILYKNNYSEKLVQSIKFGETIKLAKSKYCVFCGDDDFIVPNAIIQAVKFLEENPDYVAAHGEYIGFHFFRKFPKNLRFWWRIRYKPYSIEQQSPINRLEFHLKNYVHVIWSVKRTAVAKKCYKEFNKSKFDPQVLAVMGELSPDSLTVIFGKVKSLSIFYGARQYFGSIISYFPTLFDAMRNGIYQREYAKYERSLLRNLEPGHLDKYINTINESLNKYNELSQQEHKTNQVNLFLGRLPSLFPYLVRQFHIFYLFSKKRFGKIGDISQENSRFHDDYESIKEIILKHGI